MIATSKKSSFPSLIDIGANLTDRMFRGIYHGSKKHNDDFDQMLGRARNNHVTSMIITGGSLTDSEEALNLASGHDNLYSTVGCHPTRCNEFDETDSTSYLDKLTKLALQNPTKVVAVGEMGLDYDRTQFCSPEVQKKYFSLQLNLAQVTGLPLFLHCRNAWSDFFKIMDDNRSKWITSGGVLHSFDGNIDDLKRALDLGLFIGLNGCSMKTSDNLQVIKQIPENRILIETDCPWCEIKKSHAGYGHIVTQFGRSKDASNLEVPVKNRNEPAMLIQVLEVIASIKGLELINFAQQVQNNTLELFKKLKRD